MDTIIDYVKWLGHQRFDDYKFNEIDNLVLCQLSYYDYKNVLKDGDSKTLNECYHLMCQENIRVCIVGGNEDYPLYLDFLQAVADAKRYGDIRISDYVDVLDDQVQFAAMTFHISPNEVFVAYRGTDDTIIGWKEDFMLSFTEIPAQMRAVNYLRDVVCRLSHKLYVGGHSKGGNLALYASAHMDEAALERIEHVYINDGPGLCDTVMDTSVIMRIQHKITRILPEYCVIGKLFEPDIHDTQIVKSSADGIMQHMLLSWGIDHGSLLRAEGHTPESKWISDTMDIWLENIPNEKRQGFVEHLFSALSAGGAVSLMDIAGKGVGGFEQVLISLIESDKEVRKTAAKLPETAIFGSAVEKVRSNKTVRRLLQSKLAQGLFSIIAGILFIVMPKQNMMVVFLVVMAGILVFLLGRTLYHLYHSHWNLYQERTLVYITITFLVIYLLMIFKEHALSLFSSIFFGILFLIAGYNCAVVLKEKDFAKNQKWIKVRYILEMVLFFILGFFNFVAPETTIEWYAVSVGIVLLLDGASRIAEYIQGVKYI
ncbi:MAG: DUF2974 domain-containing protein [Lachnospiraceae bacterium]|nr:DUF2974 domain-containing protein [Lachnospiraceae bacterium]